MLIKRFIVRKSHGLTSIKLSPQARIVHCAPSELSSVQIWAEMATDEIDSNVRNLRTFKIVTDNEWYDANWQHRATAVNSAGSYSETLHVIEWATPDRTTARAPR